MGYGSGIILKTDEQIQTLREANQIVASTLSMLRERIAPGVSTWQLDRWADDYAQQLGGKPAFKGYRGYPASLCVSLNEQVVHGIPSKRIILKEGDIVSIDFGVKYKGFYGDSAVTIPVAQISTVWEKLIRVTEESLYKGIEQARPGNRVNDISLAVQTHVEQNGFSVVRQYVGHGIGAKLHEPPEIPNYVRGERTPRLQPGMVLAIEPMVNAGTSDVLLLKDGWTVVTKDGAASAHFEHSVVVTDNEAIILSAATAM